MYIVMDNHINGIFKNYKTISFETLSHLIGSANRAETEDIVSKMIMDKNIEGYIENDFIVRRDSRSNSFNVLTRISELAQSSID